MKTIKVIFANSKYNYTTIINSKVTQKEAEVYWIGKYVNLEVYPNENMQKYIDILIK